MGVTLQHMGDLHPFEQVLVFVLAFAPILLLAATVVIARKRDAGEGVEEPGVSRRLRDDLE